MNTLTTVVGSATVTADMFKDLVPSVQANIGVVLPVGIGVMCCLLAVKIVPKVIKSFF